jgi:hypothetical protein
MRRIGLILAMLLGLVGTSALPPAAGVAAADDSLLAGMGYPEVKIEVSDDGFRMPGQVTAGRTLLTLANVGQESRHSRLLRLPDDLTIGDLFANQSEDAPPPWFFKSTFVGFPGETLPGKTNRAVVDLSPGLYLVVDDFLQPFVVLPAQGDGGTPAAAADPPSDGTVSLFEYGFKLPTAVTPGRHVWQVLNAGREPHELQLAKVPAGTTAAQVVALLTSGSEDENATPVGGGPSASESIPVGGMGQLSPGLSAWTEVDLESGTYVALCFVFDQATGMLHAALGMVAVFTVTG